jgi:uncharacterized membrane protein YfhO
MQDNINIDEEINQATAKQWLQDNLRVIISILIVVAIAGGIYSYSKRSEESMMTKEATVEEGISLENLAVTTDQVAENAATKKSDVKETPEATSQETEKSFVETAGRGDGTTVLARRALANYLEKNQDTTLSAEHKIYIEDYLRKKASYKGSVHVGTSVEFSKDLIQEAIGRSKTLNERQLKNLHKYAVRVPSLS